MSQFSHTASQTQRTAQSSMYSTNSLIYNELTNICEKNIIVFCSQRSIGFALIYVFQPLSQLLILSLLLQYYPEYAYMYASVQPYFDLIIRLFPQCLYLGINPTIYKQLATNQSALACSKIFMHASLYVVFYYIGMIVVGSFTHDSYQQIAFFCSVAVSLEYLCLVYMLGGREMIFVVKNVAIFAVELILLYFVVFWQRELQMFVLGLIEYLVLLANFVPTILLFSQQLLSLSFPVHLSQDGLRPFMPKLLLTSFVHFLESLGDIGPKTLMNYLAMYLTLHSEGSNEYYRHTYVYLIFLYIQIQKLFAAIPNGSLQAICQIASMCYYTQLYRKVYQIYQQACFVLCMVLCVISCFFFVIFRPLAHFFFVQLGEGVFNVARYAVLITPLLQIQAAQQSLPCVFNKSSNVMRDRYFMIAIYFIIVAAIALAQRFGATKQSFCNGIICFDVTCALCYTAMYCRSLRYVRKLRYYEAPKIDMSYNIDASGASAAEGRLGATSAKILSQLPISSMLSQGNDNNSSSARNNSNTLNLNPDSQHALSTTE